MDLTSGQYAQLIIGLFLGLVLFLVAYRAPIRFSVPLLILLIPFQAIQTRYGTLNMVLIFLLGAALFFRGRLPRVPMLGILFGIMLAYLASLSQAHRAIYFDSILYIIALISSFVLFYIVYNFVRDVRDPRYVVHILIVLNVLVIFYCFLQIVAGGFGRGEQLTLFGIEQLSIHRNRGGSQPRLTGPFGSVGITAEYLVLSILLIGYELIYTKARLKKILLSVLVAANLAFLVATGNRGGFLSLIFGMLMFFYLFRRELGFGRIVGMIGGGAVLLSIMSLVIINYTEFGSLYERLEDTEVEGVVPDTRRGTWPVTVEYIKDRPLLGYGPYLRAFAETQRPRGSIPGQPLTIYPHNLYLYLLYTVGGVGLAAFLAFFIGVLIRLQRTRTHFQHHSDEDLYLDGLLRLGSLLILVFLVDQIKVEFLRPTLISYWHFVFCLMAMLVGFADMAKRRNRIEDHVSQEAACYIPKFSARQSGLLGH